MLIGWLMSSFAVIGPLLIKTAIKGHGHIFLAHTCLTNQDDLTQQDDLKQDRLWYTFSWDTALPISSLCSSCWAFDHTTCTRSAIIMGAEDWTLWSPSFTTVSWWGSDMDLYWIPRPTKPTCLTLWLHCIDITILPVDASDWWRIYATCFDDSLRQRKLKPLINILNIFIDQKTFLQ